MAKNTILSGAYRNYAYEVRVVSAHHCGYVRLPKSHKYASDKFPDYDAINDDIYKIYDSAVHGGLTYMATESDGFRYLGWDYAHYMDRDDPAICGNESKLIGLDDNYKRMLRMDELFRKDPDMWLGEPGSHFYTAKEVVQECKDFIDILIEMDNH